MGAVTDRTTTPEPASTALRDTPVTVMVIPAAVCLVLSVLACGEIAHGSWRVRRPAGAADPASA
jgi:hypothetical protein